jgi:hypothetical protein
VTSRTRGVLDQSGARVAERWPLGPEGHAIGRDPRLVLSVDEKSQIQVLDRT